MKVSAEGLERYGNALNAIADESVAAFKADIAQYAAELGDFSTWTDAQRREFRDFARDKMAEYWGVYGDASASVGSMLFDETIEGGVPEGYDMADQVDDARANASAHYWAKFMHGENASLDQFVNGCASFVRRNVSHSADMLAIDIAKKNKRIKFARVPRGPTCGFCIMLASRGFVYATAETAGEAGQYHDDCDCRIVPGYDGLKVEGYDPEGMYKRYLACRETIGGSEQLWKDWQALTPDERNGYGRGVRASAFSDDPDVDKRLSDQIGKQANGFNDYVAHRICQEMDTRDRRWLFDGTPLPEAESERGAKPKKHERDTEEKLRPAGYRLIFRKPSNNRRIADVYFVSGTEDKPIFTQWEMKHSEGDQKTRTLGKNNIRNQFMAARGQSRNLIIDVEKVVGFTDSEGKLVDRDYVIDSARAALVHHEVAPWFDEAIIVFGHDDFLKVRKRKKEA